MDLELADHSQLKFSCKDLWNLNLHIFILILTCEHISATFYIFLVKNYHWFIFLCFKFLSPLGYGFFPHGPLWWVELQPSHPNSMIRMEQEIKRKGEQRMCQQLLKINSWKLPQNISVYIVLIRIFSWDAERSNLYFGWSCVQQKLDVLLLWKKNSIDFERWETNEIESKRGTVTVRIVFYFIYLTKIYITLIRFQASFQNALQIYQLF